MTPKERSQSLWESLVGIISLEPIDAKRQALKVAAIEMIERTLIEERKAAIEEEREACAKIAHDEAVKWGMDLNGRTAGLHIEGEIRARSS